MDIITRLAWCMYQHKSVDRYSSFDEARLTAIEGDKRIVFDAFSLTVYEHNLSADEYKRLGRDLASEINKEDHAWLSERNEFILLHQYMTICCIPPRTKIKKGERPDFILSFESGTVGIEITSLTPASQCAAGSLANKISLSGYSTRIVEPYKHFKFEIESINDTWLISDPQESGKPLLDNIEDANRHIQRKIDMYTESSLPHQQILILCNASDCLFVTSKAEANCLLSRFRPQLLKKEINIALVYCCGQSYNAAHLFQPHW